MRTQRPLPSGGSGGKRGWGEDKYGGRQRNVALITMLVGLGVVVALVVTELATNFLPISQATLPLATPTNTLSPTPFPSPTLTPTLAPTPTPAVASESPGDWTSYLSSAGTGFDPWESTITPATAPGLKLHWIKQGASVITVQPVEANGIVYWGDWSGNEHATSVSGQAVWSTSLGPPHADCGSGFSYAPNPGVTSTASVATIAGRSMVFVGGSDGQVYALDALTGKVLWHTPVGPSSAHFVWSSPAVYAGSVYVGVASFADCPLVRGQLLRLDAATGALQNVFQVSSPGCLGGTVWGSPTIDAATGYVYFATGGPDVSCLEHLPFTSSVIKVSASDLSLVDHWQVPADEQAGDGDFGNTPTLFSYRTGGPRQVEYHLMVGVAHKNGTFYAFDRNHLSAGPMWRAHIALGGTQPLSDEGSISPAAFDGKTLYVAGGYTNIKGAGCYGSVRALDPATGAFLWEHCMSDGPVFGAVTAAPGLVVVGEGSSIVVLAASTGQTLFTYADPSGGPFYGAACIANGMLYQGNTDGQLFAFGL
jgi:outer membrane protein assembly factor BamB